MFEDFVHDPDTVIPSWFSLLATRSKYLPDVDLAPFGVIKDIAYLDQLLDLHRGSGEDLTKPYYVSAFEIAAACRILGVDTPPQVQTILGEPPPSGDMWFLANFCAAAASLSGANTTPLDHDARLKSPMWKLSESLLGAYISGVSFETIYPQLIKLMLGLGWRVEAFTTPRMALLVSLLPDQLDDTWWASVAPEPEWLNSRLDRGIRIIEHQTENHRDGVRFHLKSMTSEFPHADQAFARTLVTMGFYLQIEVLFAIGDMRSWKSWTKKFSDPKKGLWIMTQTEHRGEDIDAGWIELAEIYFRYLITLIEARTGHVPRARWRFGRDTIVDVSL